MCLCSLHPPDASPCPLSGSTVCEVMVGLGPCGELRYPAYQEADSKWSYFGPEMFTASGMKASMRTGWDWLCCLCTNSSTVAYILLCGIPSVSVIKSLISVLNMHPGIEDSTHTMIPGCDNWCCGDVVTLPLLLLIKSSRMAYFMFLRCSVVSLVLVSSSVLIVTCWKIWLVLLLRQVTLSGAYHPHRCQGLDLGPMISHPGKPNSLQYLRALVSGMQPCAQLIQTQCGQQQCYSMDVCCCGCSAERVQVHKAWSPKPAALCGRATRQ